jgi:phosphatidylserine decarboxylase
MAKKHYTSLASSLFGKFANRENPTPLQNIINRTYVKSMGLDMSRFDTPESYKSLNKLFTRALKQMPKFDKKIGVIISPVDALITDFGQIKEGKAYQIKGMSYNIDYLLGSNYSQDLKLLNGGNFVNFYLSPKDYHRYHIPIDLQVLSVTHIPGKLYPVNMPLLKNKLNLFIENERVVLECITKNGKKLFMILVGALNVGKMVLTFDDRIQTNACVSKVTHYKYDDLKFKKGDLFGWFEMGSTIVIFTEEGLAKFDDLQINQKVTFGDTIGKVL